MHRVVVVGGGFGGVRCCQELVGSGSEITLLDRRNFHLFQPLLYQVATGGLSPGDIAAPLRSILKNVHNARVLLGDVTDLDVDQREVILADDRRLHWDTLVVATGARHSYFGKDGWEKYAPGLKSIEDATEIRARVLDAFERAEIETDPVAQRALLSFVVVGGGPTGIELAGALGELARQTMRGEFRNIKPGEARITLVEGSSRILSMYTEQQAAYGQRALERLGVEVRTEHTVTNIDGCGVDVESRSGKERIAAKTVLWAAGVAGSPLGKVLQERAGAVLDRAGRVVVEPDCTVKGRPDIVVIGDLANFAHTEDKKPLPGVAPVAMQMGAYAARVVYARINKSAIEPFRFFDKGTMAVIGRNRAVARVGFGLDINLTGFLAWIAWLFIHIMYLVEFENRVLVAIQWANYYVTRHRGARLIAGRDIE